MKPWEALGERIREIVGDRGPVTYGISHSHGELHFEAIISLAEDYSARLSVRETDLPQLWPMWAQTLENAVKAFLREYDVKGVPA